MINIKPDSQADQNYLTLFPNQRSSGKIYRHVEALRQARYSEWKSNGIEKYLSLIAEEIQIRTRITQQEIFLIGELLTDARETLKEYKKISFKEWVEERCEFGYHTALNFINVYSVCLGHVNDIEYIKPSILYKISQKSFSKQLRTYLLDEGVLKHMTIAKFKELCEKFEKSGLNGIKSQINDINEISIVSEQINNSIQKTRDAIYKLKLLQSSLEYDGMNQEEKMMLQFIPDKQGARASGDFVRRNISASFTQCINILEKTLSSCTLDSSSVRELTEKIKKLESSAMQESLGNETKKENVGGEQDNGDSIIDIEPTSSNEESGSE